MTPKLMAFVAAGLPDDHPQKAITAKLAAEWQAALKANEDACLAYAEAQHHQRACADVLNATWKRCNDLCNEIGPAYEGSC